MTNLTRKEDICSQENMNSCPATASEFKLLSNFWFSSYAISSQKGFAENQGGGVSSSFFPPFTPPTPNLHPHLPLSNAPTSLYVNLAGGKRRNIATCNKTQ